MVSVLDDMQGSSLILVDKKNRSLLKCLAYYEEFRTVLQYCNQSFDYEAEKRKALQRVGEHKVLRLPKGDRQLVALVAGLLLEFDEGSMDFVTFASDYFPCGDKQESFQHCYTSVLEPFKQALVRLVVQGADEEPRYIERAVDFASEGLRPQAEYLLVAFVKRVRESNMSEVAREEYLVMLEGLAAALDTRDTLIIKAIWLGIKRTFSADGFCKKEAEAMDDLLKMYLITK